jgi:hypothetical protein
MIGSKCLIYAIDTKDMLDVSRNMTREITVEFFKTYLGFVDDEIIFVDRMEF